MAKLFQCNYLENNDDGAYLTVGCDDDTEETVRAREIKKRDNWNCLYLFGVRQIVEIDGHKIMSAEKLDEMVGFFQL